MPIEILMPALSPTMTEGTLARWLKREGDALRAGEAVAEIETDKATMEVEVTEDGRLGRILVPAGTAGVAVNTPIATILGEDEAVTSKAAASPPAPAASPVVAPALASPPVAPARPEAVPPGASAGSGVAGPVAAGVRVFASPLARRLAEQAGLDLATVTGSGPQGRIVKADIDAARARAPAVAPVPVPATVGPTPPHIAAPAVVPAPPPRAAAPAAPAAPAPKPAARPAAATDAKALADAIGQRYRAVPNSTMRKTIARRLTESKQTIPHFYLTIDCVVDELQRIRKDLNQRDDKLRLSVNDFIIRAVALALRKVPAANVAWTEDALLHFEQVDVSVAVATPAGLITPVIRAADTKGLATLSAEMRALASRARDGKLTPEDYQGGNFTISNLGMFGIKAFSAVINPPQACLLAIGASEPRPIVRNGALEVATVMTCTLSVDHRAVDGAVGADYLAAFKTLIEQPLTMLL